MRLSALVVFTLLGVVACADKKALPTARGGGSPLADSADQIMFGARHVLTSEGLNRARLRADTAYFFEDNTRIELENVHTIFFNAAGAEDAVLTSRRGTYNQRLGNMVARENVVVVSKDGRRLTTSHLVYDQPRNEISSDSAFVMTEPNRRLEGIGFKSDPDMNNIRILKGASGMARSIPTGPAPGGTSSTTPER